MNRICKINDAIDFGKNQGVPFHWIYRLHTPYLEWIIKETDLCFHNLNEFYQYGRPKRIINDSISESSKSEIYEKLIKLNGKVNKGESTLVTVPGIKLILESQLLEPSNFEEFELSFSQDLYSLNGDKLLNANLNNSSTIASIDDTILKSLFN